MHFWKVIIVKINKTENINNNNKKNNCRFTKKKKNDIMENYTIDPKYRSTCNTMYKGRVDILTRCMCTISNNFNSLLNK